MPNMAFIIILYSEIEGNGRSFALMILFSYEIECGLAGCYSEHRKVSPCRLFSTLLMLRDKKSP